MFHRAHDGVTQPDTTQDIENTAQKRPEQQSFVYQTKMIDQTVMERFTKNDTSSNELANNIAANESQPLTPKQFYVYESPIHKEAEKDIPTMTPADNDMKTENKDQAATPPSRIDIPGGVFSRPGQQAPIAGRAPNAYPGAYPGVATYGQTNMGAANEPAAGRKLYIGQGITLSGEIESCDHLVVEGTVEAALKGASVLEIAEAGSYFGTVDIDEATIAGRFEGDLTVRGRLTIKASGSITGSIAYKELAAEAGATIDGKVTPLDAKNAGGARKPAGKSKTSDFGGAELPFEGKAVAAG